jgi:hypothetical protein
MLWQYPAFAANQGGLHIAISARTRASKFTVAEVETEIGEGRPVVAGISPHGGQFYGASEHVALIVGYDDGTLIVNDPYPFGAANPYEAAGGDELIQGQYKIAYDSFVKDLKWRESIYNIRCSGSDCAGLHGVDDDDEANVSDEAYGRSCRTPGLQCGPFYDQAPLPVGSPCWCATPMGLMHGQVVQ